MRRLQHLLTEATSQKSNLHPSQGEKECAAFLLMIKHYLKDTCSDCLSMTMIMMLMLTMTLLTIGTITMMTMMNAEDDNVLSLFPVTSDLVASIPPM